MSPEGLGTQEEADLLAKRAIGATNEAMQVAVEGMLSQAHHVLLFQEGQENLARLTLQRVTRSVVELMATSNPALDSLVVLDSDGGGWLEVAPNLVPVTEEELYPGFLHSSQSIVAFGSEFLKNDVVVPIARRAVRFYAAMEDDPGSEGLVEAVHPLQEVVVL